MAFAAQAFEQGEDFLPGARVERAGGFVGHDDRRPVDQGARDRHALLLAAGEFAGTMLHAFAQTHRRQRFRGAALTFGRRHARIAQRHRHVVLRAHPRQQIEALEHEADLVAAQDRAFFGVQRRDIHAVAQVGAGGRRVETADEIHQRRFAGTGRPHDRDEFAVFDLQVHALERGHFGFGAGGIDLAQYPRFDHGMRGAGARDCIHLPGSAVCTPTITCWPALMSPVISVLLPSDAPTRTMICFGLPSAST